MSYVLDLANIVGGLLLAMPLLLRLPTVGPALGRFADRVGPWGWIVGIVALVAGGFYLIVHVFSGPHVFHFELVGIAVGVLLAWERLTKRAPITTPRHSDSAGMRRGDPYASGVDRPGRPAIRHTEPAGAVLVIAIFGIIAVVVGIQGLLTPG